MSVSVPGSVNAPLQSNWLFSYRSYFSNRLKVPLTLCHFRPTRLLLFYSTRLTRRTYCSATTGTPDANSISLSQPLPWLPPIKYATVTDKGHETRITKLNNGLRVATQNKFGQYCTVGGKFVMFVNYLEDWTQHCYVIWIVLLLSVVLDSGSRYEVNYPSGITHFLQKLSFGVSAFSRFSIFTTRIRRITGGYVFTGVFLFNFRGGGGGYPLLRSGGGGVGGAPFPGLYGGGGWAGGGGYPFPGLDGRSRGSVTPFPGLDGPPSQVWIGGAGGYPFPGLEGVPPTGTT